MVMKKMDELTPYNEGLVLTPLSSQKPIESTIESILDECARDILVSHPLSKLPLTSIIPIPIGQPDGSGFITLPSNYLRLVSLQIKGFKRDVVNLISPEDPLYKLQSNPHVRGSKNKPVAFLAQKVVGGTPRQVIHYFSLNAGDTHTTEQFIYVALIPAENFNSYLLDGLGWLAASKALVALGHVPEGAKAMELFSQFNSRR
jgi:hypothetical protein